MTIETKVCDNCKQSAFVNLMYKFKDREICKDCFDKFMTNLYSWENPNLAIKLNIGCSYSDFETIIVPFIENCEHVSEIDIYTDTVLDAFNKLVKNWEFQAWGFDGSVQNLELVNIKDFHPNIDTSKIIEDSEFWNFQIYEDLSFDSDLYDSPFDNSPNGMKFVSWFSEQCMIGEIYSKDFAYYHCEDCDRYVCGQSPSNGWHSQVHFHDGWIECNKCYEERTLRDGINEDFDNNIPGQFYNYEDIESNGWTKDCDKSVGSGYSSYTDPNPTIEYIGELIDSGLKVLINYESMAIGGLGGYISIYTKS